MIPPHPRVPDNGSVEVKKPADDLFCRHSSPSGPSKFDGFVVARVERISVPLHRNEHGPGRYEADARTASCIQAS